MNKFNINKTLLAFNLFALLLIVYYLFKNSADFKRLGDAGYVVITSVIILQVASMLVTGLFIRTTIKPFGILIPAKDAFKASVLSAFGNFFMPAGSGTSLRAVYLNKTHKLDYTKFMSTLYGNYVVVFSINSIIGLSTLIFISPGDDRVRYWIIFVFLVAMFLISVLFMSKKINRYLILISKKSLMPSKIQKYTEISIEGWRMIIASKELGPIILLTLINVFVQTAILYLLTFSISDQVGLAGIFLLSTLSAFSVIINITPGSIGIREAIFGFSAFAVGLPVADIVFISLLERLTRFMAMILAWLFTQKNNR